MYQQVRQERLPEVSGASAEEPAAASGVIPSVGRAAYLRQSQQRAAHALPEPSVGSAQEAEAAPQPTLHRGSQGAAVADLQRRLSDAGEPLTPDGSFGPLTQGAVTRFQAAHELDADGVVGPRTWAVLLGGGPKPPSHR